jgi:hypothetical protein
MHKRFWQPSHDREFKTLPQLHRALIRGNHKIELHGSKPASFGSLQRMRTHRARNASTRRMFNGDITAIRHMRAAAPLIGLQKISPEYFTRFFENEYLMPVREPISQGIFARNVHGDRVCLARAKNRFDEVYNSLGIGRQRGTNQTTRRRKFVEKTASSAI